MKSIKKFLGYIAFPIVFLFTSIVVLYEFLTRKTQTRAQIEKVEKELAETLAKKEVASDETVKAMDDWDAVRGKYVKPGDGGLSE